MTKKERKKLVITSRNKANVHKMRKQKRKKSKCDNLHVNQIKQLRKYEKC